MKEGLPKTERDICRVQEKKTATDHTPEMTTGNKWEPRSDKRGQKRQSTREKNNERKERKSKPGR